MMKQYNVIFKGYRRDCNKATFPTYSGIYMVYRCTYHSDTEKVSLKEIIYIGQAKNLNERLNNHEKYSDFQNQCKTEEELCYAYAKVDEKDLDVVENAIVFAQKPPLNTDLKDSYNHDSAGFLVEGNCSLLKYTDFKIQ